MKISIEEVTPELAKEWLAKSKGNRSLSEAYVLSLAVSMEQGKWIPEASEVAFDVTGALIDGHHRLSAVDVFGKPIKMAVKRGLPEEARNVIDTGRARTLRDLLSMYRSSVDYPAWRRAALNTCAYLLVDSRSPMVRTLDAFDSWMRHFKDGIDWVMAATMNGGIPSSAVGSFKAAPVLGAFAFAHRLNPEGVSKFHRAAAMGEGLQVGDPALTLRNFVLIGYNGHNRTGLKATGRREISIKVLAAIYAELNGERLHRLQSNSHALPFFRAAYKSRTLAALVEPWQTENSTESAPNGIAR